MKKTKITILFPERKDLTTIREKTADMARLLKPSRLRNRAALKLYAAAKRLDSLS